VPVRPEEIAVLDVRLLSAEEFAAQDPPLVLALPVGPPPEPVDESAEAPADSDEKRAEPGVLLPTVATQDPSLIAAVSGWLADDRRGDPPARGTSGEVASLPRPGSTPALVLLYGIGDGDTAAWRKTGAALTNAGGGDERLVAVLPEGLEPDAVRALVEGAMLASYRFSMKAEPKPPTLIAIDLVVAAPGEYEEGRRRAEAVAVGTALARDLTNTPSTVKSPEWFADQAASAFSGDDGAHGVEVTIRDPEWLAASGFGGVLAVGSGSSRGPRLLELRWNPPAADGRHVVLVGKGITFDTGGISIKPAAGMQMMKKDMGGGAAVVGAVRAVAALGLPVRVTALVPLAENMPSGAAYRPGDVVRHYGGRTSEIFSTDAEGRIVLGDALAYAVATLEPDVLVDLATLTGGQSVALGKRTAALFAEDADLAGEFTAAAERTGERVWRLPLPDDYLQHIESDVADANNSGGREAQTATAALFLRGFTGRLRPQWVHLDMSAPAWSDSASDELTKGATGWGVRLLTSWLEAATPQG
jgi:leucyl aminopeptidase